MITIYWGANTTYSPEGIRADAPESILQKLFRHKNSKELEGDGDYKKCPALIDELKNVYGLKSYFDYTLKLQSAGASSPDYDQEFFNKYFEVKSSNLYFYRINFAFFTEEPSLEMSLLPAYMEDNNVVNNTIMLPGKIDIGKYFRGLHFAFHMKENCNELTFNKDEICYYVKFHTQKKLKFKQFLWTPKLEEMGLQMMAAKGGKYDYMNLDYYYNIFDRFNFKKKMLKNIKENLCKE